MKANKNRSVSALTCRLAAGGICLTIFFIARPAVAQIYKFVDDQGARHFTNTLESLPDGARAEARISIDEGPMSRVDDGLMSRVDDGRMSRVDEPSDSSSSKGEDLDEVRSAPLAENEGPAHDDGPTFDQGWEDGWRAAVDQRGPLPAPEPPVIIFQVPPPMVVEVPAQPYDPSGQYYRSPYEGQMTVPFDGGRSRGLTHRQHLQEQRRTGGR